MATAAQRRAYARKLNNISKQHQRMERDMLTTSVQLLRNVRDRIAGQLTGTEFNEFRIAEQTAQLNTIIDEYDAQLRSLANGSVRQSFDLGERAVIEPLQEIDLTGVFFRPSEAQVDILAQFSADLVGGVTEDLRRKVNRTIRMSALGGQSSLDAMRQITADLGIPTKRTARAKGVSYEAERILRTETNRAYNLANYSQQEKVSQDIPGLQKRWMATGDGRTRISHLNAHGQTVGIKDKFKVGGSELNFPGDPAGPASETINCRCRSITIPPDFDDVEMPVDKKVEDEKEKRDIQKPKRVTVPAFSTVRDAQDYARNMLGIDADYTGATPEQANAVNRGISRMQQVYPHDTSRTLKVRFDDNENRTAIATVEERGRGITFSRTAFRADGIRDLETELRQTERSLARIEEKLERARQEEELYGDKIYTDEQIQFFESQIAEYRAKIENPVPFGAPTNMDDVVVHEFGHLVQSDLEFGRISGETDFLYPSIRPSNVAFEDQLVARMEIIAKREGLKISEYATTNGEEYFAESWTAYHQGRRDIINPDLLEIFDRITR